MLSKMMFGLFDYLFSIFKYNVLQIWMTCLMLLAMMLKHYKLCFLIISGKCYQKWFLVTFWIAFDVVKYNVLQILMSCLILSAMMLKHFKLCFSIISVKCYRKWCLDFGEKLLKELRHLDCSTQVSITFSLLQAK